jgi:hypothetical protein
VIIAAVLYFVLVLPALHAKKRFNHGDTLNHAELQRDCTANGPAADATSPFTYSGFDDPTDQPRLKGAPHNVVQVMTLSVSTSTLTNARAWA